MRFAPPTNWPSRSDVVRDDADAGADRPDRPGVGPEGRPDLVRLSRPERLAEGALRLQLVQPVVAAHEREHDLAADNDRHRLRRRRRVDAEELGQALDRRDPRRLDLLRRVQARWELRRARCRPPHLGVRGVVAVGAADELGLAVRTWGDELLAAVPAHHADVGLDRPGLEPAALEDADVDVPVLGVGLLEPGPVAVEAVGVLHDELARAQDPAPRPRLVALLRLLVVPDLRQLAIGADVPARRGR